MEAQLGAIWEEKLQRVSGKGEEREQRLVLFSKVWDAVLPRLQPKDSIKEGNVKEEEGPDPDVVAFASLQDSAISRTAALATFGTVFSYLLFRGFTYVVDVMRRKRDTLRRDVASALERWREDGSVSQLATIFVTLLQWHATWVRPFLKPPHYQEPEAFTSTFHSILFDALPPDFPEALAAVFTYTLENRDQEHDETFRALAALGMIRNFETLISRVGYQAIERKMNETCKKAWDQPCLSMMKEWVQLDIVPWSTHVFSFELEKEPRRTSSFGNQRDFTAKYEFHVYKSLFDMRVSELFEIITSVKVDSQVLLDLKECTSKISGRTDLIRGLRQQISKRLLHPGADTDEIIDFYISMIRCLRVIDPQGVILFRVADPIRIYLRNRSDTTHHIVTELINEEGELAQEARAPIVAEIEHEDYSDPNWLPEPPDAGPRFRMLRPGDLISTLVSIYDSHDLFIKELQTLFASILLQSRDGTFDSEACFTICFRNEY
ncbi:hypothetical protein FRC17_002610 [Serendipita sp. 399]|nr:hypothetical protein FRC17_002610 [Serendipita sp. 399]